jgi:hypothetical protein
MAKLAQKCLKRKSELFWTKLDFGHEEKPCWVGFLIPASLVQARLGEIRKHVPLFVGPAIGFVYLISSAIMYSTSAAVICAHEPASQSQRPKGPKSKTISLAPFPLVSTTIRYSASAAEI